MFLTFFLVQELIGDDIFSIKKREYLGEVRMRKGENIAVFPCEIFHRRRINDPSKIKETNNIDIDNKNGNLKSDFWRYCFDYVTSNMKGSINTTTTFCMPAELEGNLKIVFYEVIQRFYFLSQLIILNLLSKGMFM